MRASLAVAGMAVVVSLAGPAAAATYDCTFREGVTDYSWITQRYIIQHDADDSARVVDGMIEQIHGGPIKAQVIEETKGKIVFGWELKTRDNTGQLARMKYRAVWFKSGGYMRLTVTPLGYANMFESQGRCTIG